MVSYLQFICATCVFVAGANDNSDYVQMAVSSARSNRSAIALVNSKQYQTINRSSARLTSSEATCEVTLYEHWATDAKPDYTGNTHTVTGTGNFKLDSWITPETGQKIGASSIKVSGPGCAAYGYETEDCSGDETRAIKSVTKLEGLPAGVVGPSEKLAEFWGCNDCVQCVRVEQVEQGDHNESPNPATVAPTAAPTSTPTLAPTNWLKPYMTGEFYISQPNHPDGNYVGMCGGVGKGTCEGSNNKVFGYTSNKKRTKWIMEDAEDGNVYLKQVNHDSYMGLCGGYDGCEKSSFKVYGYASKSDNRVVWTVEKDAVDTDTIYLKQVSHASYLGMCGGAGNADDTDKTTCDNHQQQLFGYTEKEGRTKMKFTTA